MAYSRVRHNQNRWGAYLRDWGSGLLFLLLYYAAARFHLRYVIPFTEPTTIWLPAGIGLVMLLILGQRGLLFVAVAAAMVNYPLWFASTMDLSLAQSWLYFLMAVTLETAQPWLAYIMWRRFVPNGIQTWGSALRFVGLVAIAPCLLTTLLLAATLGFAGHWAGLSASIILANMSVILLGRTLGVLLVTPIHQAWVEEDWPPIHKLAPGVLGLALLALVQYAAFRWDPSYIYLTVPILLLVSLISGSRMATFATLLLVVSSVGATIAEYGPFVPATGSATYLPLLVYLLVLVVSSLVGRVQYSYVLRQRSELVQAVDQRTAELRQEVAARTAAAEAALAGERRFRALIEKAQEGIVLFDRQGQIISVGAAAISRSPQIDASGLEDFRPYIHADDLPGVEAVFAQVLANPGKNFTYTMRVRDPQAGYVWIEGAATNLLDDDAVAAVVVNYRNISERKQAEEQTAYQALLFANLSDAVISTDLLLIVRSWNAAAEEIYGWRADEAIGRPLHSLTRLQNAPGTREQLLDILLAVGDWKGEVIQLHRSGRPISIYASVALVRDASGQPSGIVAVNRDMTEQHQARQTLEQERARLAERVTERTAELQQANSELQNALNAKDEFMAGMSHELRTPLNTVLMLAELLELEAAGPLTPKQRQHLHTLRHNGMHLLGLINDILDFSKLQVNKLTVDCRSVPVADVCHASLSMVAAQAERKQLQVSLALDPAASIMYADEQRSKQILVNMLGNAIKFTLEGGSIGLKVHADAARGKLLFTVWDTGIGIAPADFERLFAPFIQLETGLTRRYGGTGLGLALASQLAHLQGGDISVQSELNKGSEFTFWLPWQG